MFIFDAKNIITFDKFNCFVKKLKEKFTKNKEEILKRYNICECKDWDKNITKYQKFRKEYRRLV